MVPSRRIVASSGRPSSTTSSVTAGADRGGAAVVVGLSDARPSLDEITTTPAIPSPRSTATAPTSTIAIGLLWAGSAVGGLLVARRLSS